MKSDLRNLATSQEAYLARQSGAYYGGAIPNAALARTTRRRASTITVINADAGLGGRGGLATAEHDEDLRALHGRRPPRRRPPTKARLRTMVSRRQGA